MLGAEVTVYGTAKSNPILVAAFPCYLSSQCRSLMNWCLDKKTNSGF